MTSPGPRAARAASALRVGVVSLIGLAALSYAAAGEAGAPRTSSTYDCASCHPDAHPGFDNSGHALAAVEPWYERSLAITPDALRPMCAGCHAPERADAGVTCAACHVEDGVVLAPSPGTFSAPHPTRYAPQLTDGALCASCHTVALPLGRDGAEIVLQDTPAEHAQWRRVTGDQRGCVDCHARDAKAHFAGMRDPDMLAASVRIRIQAGAPDAAGRIAGQLRLENLAGHAFPTGSQMREGWARLTLTLPDGRSVAIDKQRLSLRGDPATDEPSVDTRLAPGETRSIPFEVLLTGEMPRSGLTITCTVELALVSLDYPDHHPMIPPDQPRVLPVTRARIPVPEEL